MMVFPICIPDAQYPLLCSLLDAPHNFSNFIHNGGDVELMVMGKVL